MAPVVFVATLAVVIAFVVPRSYFGFYAACLAMVAAVGAVWPTGTDHSSLLSGTGDVFYMLMCGVVAIALGARGLIIVRRPQPSQAPPSPAAWAAVGAVGAACAMAFLSLGWADMWPVWMAYIPALGILAGSFVQLLIGWRVAQVWFRAYALGAAVSSVVVFAAAAVVTGQRINTLVEAAETIAGDKPYCIQVTSTRPFGHLALSKLAFSPLTMRTQCRQGWCFENHAVLVLEDGDQRRLMNWSHRLQEFRNDVLNVRTKPLAVVCRPRPHFARDLPLLFP